VVLNYPEEIGEERRFTGRGSYRGVGAGLAFQRGRIRTGSDTPLNVPSYMFDETGPYWRSIANSKPAGYQPTFTLLSRTDPRYTSGSGPHAHPQRFTAVSVFGDDG
jgi:hypothetical protein